MTGHTDKSATFIRNGFRRLHLPSLEKMLLQILVAHKVNIWQKTADNSPA